MEDKRVFHEICKTVWKVCVCCFRTRTVLVTCMIGRFWRWVSVVVVRRRFSDAAVDQRIPILRPLAGRDTSWVCCSSSDRCRLAGSTRLGECRRWSPVGRSHHRQRGGLTGHCGPRDDGTSASCCETSRARREASFYPMTSYPLCTTTSLYTYNQ